MKLLLHRPIAWIIGAQRQQAFVHRLRKYAQILLGCRGIALTVKALHHAVPQIAFVARTDFVTRPFVRRHLQHFFRMVLIGTSSQSGQIGSGNLPRQVLRHRDRTARLHLRNDGTLNAFGIQHFAALCAQILLQPRTERIRRAVFLRRKTGADLRIERKNIQQRGAHLALFVLHGRQTQILPHRPIEQARIHLRTG